MAQTVGQPGKRIRYVGVQMQWQSVQTGGRSPRRRAIVTALCRSPVTTGKKGVGKGTRRLTSEASTSNGVGIQPEGGRGNKAFRAWERPEPAAWPTHRTRGKNNGAEYVAPPLFRITVTQYWWQNLNEWGQIVEETTNPAGAWRWNFGGPPEETAWNPTESMVGHNQLTPW